MLRIHCSLPTRISLIEPRLAGASEILPFAPIALALVIKKLSPLVIERPRAFKAPPSPPFPLLFIFPSSLTAEL